MPKPTIEQIRGLGDLAVMYNWDVAFVSFPQVAHPDSDSLNLRCVSTDVPKYTDENIETNIRGHKVGQPGQRTYGGTIVLTFVETVDAMINNFLTAWGEACYETGTGVQQLVSSVKCDLQLHLLDRQGNPIQKWLLHGCRLEDHDATGGTLTGDSNDTVKPALTIRYDYFEKKPI